MENNRLQGYIFYRKLVVTKNIMLLLVPPYINPVFKVKLLDIKKKRIVRFSDNPFKI